MLPIDDPSFSRNRRRPADAGTIAKLQTQAEAWRELQRQTNDARGRLNLSVIEAHQGGHSFRQIREATGMSIGAIQTILMKAGLIT